VEVFKILGQITLDGVTKVNAQVGALDTAFGNLGAKILAAFGIGKLISEFKGFMGDALTSVQAYQDSMSKLRDVVSPEVAGSLGSAMRELSTNMPISVTDLLAVNEVAGKLGIGGAGNIEAFTTAVGKISIVTGQQATNVAEDLGKIITQAGADVTVAEGLGSAVSTLADTTNTKSDEILATMAKITLPFTELGATLPDIAALAAEFNTITANGKESATALRGVADALKDPQKVHDFATALGVTVGELERMRDTDVVGLVGQLATKLAEGGSSADILRVALGNSAVPLQALGKDWDAVQKSMDLANQEYRTSEGLQTDYADRTDTIRTKLQLLRQKFDDIKLGVGEALVPAIGNIAKAFDDNKKSIETFFTTLGTGVANTLVWLISNKDAVVAAIAGIAVAFALVKIASIASDASKLITALNPLNLAMVGIAGLAALMANRFMDAAKDAAKIRAEAKRAADEAAQAQKDAARREFLQTHTAEQLAPQREQANQIIASYRQTTPMPAGGEMYAAQYRYLDFVPSGADAEAIRQRMNTLSASIRASLGDDAVAIDTIIRDLEESAQVALSGAEGTGLAVFEELAGKVIGTYSELLPEVASTLDAIPPKVAAVAKASTGLDRAFSLLGQRMRSMFTWTTESMDKDTGEMVTSFGEAGQLASDTLTGIFQGVAQSYIDQEGAAEAHQKAMDAIAAQEKTSQEEAAAARDKELADIQDKYNKKLISQEEYNTQTTAANQAYTDAQTAASAARVTAEETEKTAYKETHKTLLQILWDSAKAVLKSLKNELLMKAAASLAEAIALTIGLNPMAVAKYGEAAAYGAGAAGLAITGFEEGGLVKAGHPRLGLIGEGRYDEPILPLSPGVFAGIGKGITSALATMSPVPALASAGGIQVDMRGLYDGATINVRDDQDITRIARETHDLWASRMRARGYAV
jgi:TP901 family phage tail tape measure protein